MKLLSEPETAAPVECPYLPDRNFVQDYFFAMGLDTYEYDALLAAGWRCFGKYFFRPNCPECRSCIPIRIDTHDLSPSRSQRRVIRRGKDIRMEAVPPEPSEEVWQVYRKHAVGQFGREAGRTEFERTYFDEAVPSLQTEYRVNGELIAVGFLDQADGGMSSVYFSFDPDWAKYSPGILSVFREAELVRQRGKRWYYLGYWVPGCERMDYKARYTPHQLYDWKLKQWVSPHIHPALRTTSDSITHS